MAAPKKIHILLEKNQLSWPANIIRAQAEKYNETHTPIYLQKTYPQKKSMEGWQNKVLQKNGTGETRPQDLEYRNEPHFY